MAQHHGTFGSNPLDRVAKEPGEMKHVSPQTFSEHEGNVKRTLREHEGNLKGTWTEHYGNMKG
jgi:hypothetical protein